LFITDIGEITPENEMLYAVMAAFAQEQWRMILKNTRAGHRRRAEEGRMPMRLTPPLGYRIVKNHETGPDGQQPGEYYVVEEEARVVRQIFTLYASGLSLRAICRFLHDSGIAVLQPEKSKEPVPMWKPATVRGILQNRAYVGFAVWGK